MNYKKATANNQKKKAEISGTQWEYKIFKKLTQMEHIDVRETLGITKYLLKTFDRMDCKSKVDREGKYEKILRIKKMK